MGKCGELLPAMTTKVPAFNFGIALRAVRLARNLSQEDFYEVSGRTYISRLENNGADPTLSKVVQLAQIMGVHPLTLLTLAFCSKGSLVEVERLAAAIREDVGSLEDLELIRSAQRRAIR